MYIPVTGKVITPDMKEALVDFVESGKEITYGEYNELFEKEFAKYVGKKHAFFVNSGSSANLLAFATYMQLGRAKPGDEIITVAASFPTTVTPILQYGCVPVFLDIDTTLNIDATKLEEAYTEKTKGVFIAHTLGNPFNIDMVQEFCNKHGLFLIMDACDALDSRWNEVNVAHYGDIVTFSFYPAHHITTGVGGMVATDDDELARIIFSLRNWGRDCMCPPNHDNMCGHRFDKQYGSLPFGYDHKFVFSTVGYNLQNTNFNALLGVKQLEHLPEFTATRKRNYEYLFRHVKNMKAFKYGYISVPFTYTESDPSWFGFPIILEKVFDRKMVVDMLNEKGVQTRYLFAGNIIRQPMFANQNYRIVNDDLRYTDYIMNNMFWIGCWHGLTQEMLDYEILCLREIFVDS